MLRLECLNPKTAKRLAELPYAGYAGAIIRQAVDPMWGLGGEQTYEVRLERGEGPCSHCGCDCNEDLETKTVEIFARSPDAAEKKAKAEHPGWDDYEAEVVAPRIDVPPQFLAWFDDASGIEAPSGVETGNTDSTEGESPTAESGDAQGPKP